MTGVQTCALPIFRLAESGRPGPVLVDVPMDMLSREMDEDLWARTHKGNLVTMRPALDPAAAKAIAKRLARAKNPVLHAGGGILLSQASEELPLWRNISISRCPVHWPDRAVFPTCTR